MSNQTIFLTRLIFFFSFLLLVSQTYGQLPVDYVNPFIGVSTSVEGVGVYHGLGKTFPGAAYPFGKDVENIGVTQSRRAILTV